MQMLSFEAQYDYLVAIDNLKIISVLLEQGYEIDDSIKFFSFGPHWEERIYTINRLLMIRSGARLDIINEADIEEMLEMEIVHPTILQLGLEQAKDIILSSLMDYYQCEMGEIETTVFVRDGKLLLGLTTVAYTATTSELFFDLVQALDVIKNKIEKE
ncbi:hypothetical protein [Alkalihalophilus marmarensis]|uniref:hypothetical protein n=1 Tax=Alkalihalophilus marmarensis TaxID=521377 RepID=UPI002DB5854D|nr:hypothetical protein [Alkalihalophilus marmarensis]MEC2074215.1 hypothetical protein [Alkalihalophilus marmarensis]